MINQVEQMIKGFEEKAEALERQKTEYQSQIDVIVEMVGLAREAAEFLRYAFDNETLPKNKGDSK